MEGLSRFSAVGQCFLLPKNDALFCHSPVKSSPSGQFYDATLLRHSVQRKMNPHKKMRGYKNKAAQK